MNITSAEWRGDGLPNIKALCLPEDKTELLTLPRAGSVCIHVQDTGVGLTAEQLAHIGSEGVQFDANRLQAGQGSGLGLYISKGLLAQHLGRLVVASDGPGKGSTFSVELPLCRRSTAVSPASHEEKANGNGEFAMPVTPTAAPCVRRVLIVDDAASNRKMLVRLLKTRGFHCEQAENGQLAIDLYRALQVRGEHVDVIVMDYEMPVMNGPTATRKLRELGCTCLIIGVTGNLLPEDVDYFKAQKADAVLGKPLNIKAFEDVLRQHKQRKKEDIGVQQEEQVVSNNPVFSYAMHGIEMV